MIKHLIVLLLMLASIGYSQVISLGPFTLMESISEARAHCVTMTHTKSGIFEVYSADLGNKYEWELSFDDDALYNIYMVAENEPFDTYRGIVAEYTKIMGRQPDNTSSYMSSWRKDYVQFRIMHNSDDRKVILELTVSILLSDTEEYKKLFKTE